MLKPNIEMKGRVLRGVMGLALLGLAYVLHQWQVTILAVLVALGGLFALFEAAFAWCAARACGIKTQY
ncbi:MAG: DUF2892 domain-containing protein [Candidatus Methylacidiphilales bacterium]|nr:DUF2892 domain-containing protein [Candidatus Methylacidiphilales bacterium]